MVVIGTALQTRLLDTAKRQLGPGGESIVREAAQRAAELPLEQLSYAQLPALLTAIERDAPSVVGRDAAYGLAEDLDALHTDADAGLSGRMIGAVGKRLGPAAEPFLANVCGKLGVSLTGVDRAQLPQIAVAVKAEASVLLGEDTARALAAAVEESRSARPPGLVARIIDLARERAGAEGETFIREICHERLEISLDEVDIDGIALLARAVERDGPARIGAQRTAAFLALARPVLASPSEPLRLKMLELAKKKIGPAGPDFLKRACSKAGLPFEAVDYEHIMWMAEVVRTEATPLVGKKGADELAREVRNFLTGGR